MTIPASYYFCRFLNRSYRCRDEMVDDVERYIANHCETNFDADRLWNSMLDDIDEAERNMGHYVGDGRYYDYHPTKKEIDEENKRLLMIQKAEREKQDKVKKEFEQEKKVMPVGVRLIRKIE